VLGGLCLEGSLLCVPVSRPLPGGDLPALGGKPNRTWRQIFLYLEAKFPILGDRPAWTLRQTTCVWRPNLYLEADHLCNFPILAGQPPCIWRPTRLSLEANRPVLRNQGFNGSGMAPRSQRVMHRSCPRLFISIFLLLHTYYTCFCQPKFCPLNLI
jgi:hypothetical protein